LKKGIVVMLSLVVIILGLVLPACAAQPMGKYMEVDAAQSKALIDKTPDLIIIDVSPAYAAGHLPHAVSYPVGDGSLDKAIPMLDKNGKYLVYCHSEAASVMGAQKLVDAGFKTVYRLKGEYQAWVNAGYPVEK
jgi:rhodanese-related sulfurtransferase